jgi:hypothetical protein
MSQRHSAGALALVATLITAIGSRAAADHPAAEKGRPSASLSRRNIIPVSEIKAGMEGYGLTVFQGVKPDKFRFRVLGVLKNYLPRQDVVLFTSDDPRLKHTGVVRGMSGSPMYLNGRLAGALSYGWTYWKDPIGAFTPIEYMLEVGERPLRGPNRTALAQSDNDVSRQLLAQVLGVTPDEPPASGAPHAAAPPWTTPPPTAGLQRVAMPLSLTGFAPRAVEELRHAFQPLGIEPMQIGSGGGEQDGPRKFEPGGSMGVALIRGDMSAVGTCTVTYVEGSRVLACGHPMLGLGETYLPVYTARIFTHLASSYSSMVVPAPMVEAGSLVMDRQAAIVADTDQRIAMIPITVTVGGNNLVHRTMRAEVAKHKFLTPMLASAVVMSAAQEAAPDIANAIVSIRSAVKVHGFEALSFEDRVFTADGLSPRVLSFSGGFRALNEILFNPFEPAHVERLSFEVEISYRPDVAEMVGLRVDSLEVTPGAQVNLYVTMRPYHGAEYVETIPFEVPRDYAGLSLSIELTPGPLARPPVPTPESLSGVIENLRKPPFPGDTFVVTLLRPSDGVAYRGRLMPELPPSEIDTLRQSTSIRRMDSYRAVTQVVRHAGRVVVGRQSITFKVKDIP